ncbi:hypothetical protein DESC_480266 [Desulfosarcina cetonica]|nr:hypothetical protein DESC_480266 [Desulfosarcina cetonica]
MKPPESGLFVGPSIRRRAEPVDHGQQFLGFGGFLQIGLGRGNGTTRWRSPGFRPAVIGFLIQGGQHDDGNVAQAVAAPQAAEEAQTRLLRQHGIDDDQPGDGVLGLFQSLGNGGGADRAEAVGSKQVGEKNARVRLVFDHEDGFRGCVGVHRLPPWIVVVAQSLNVVYTKHAACQHAGIDSTP